MKRIAFIFVPALLVLIVLSSCKKEDVKPKAIVLYETDFSSNDDIGQWKTGALATGLTGTLQGGYYEFRNTSSGGYVTGDDDLFNGVNGNNMAVESGIKISYISSNQSFEARGGLMWNNNLKNNSRFYFEISTSGQYIIWGFPYGDNRDYVIYKNNTSSNVIHPGQYNVLRIELINGQLHFLINGTEVYSMERVNDNTLKDVGFSVYSESNLQADYFKTFQLP
jgi:hypothetical protein